MATRRPRKRHTYSYSRSTRPGNPLPPGSSPAWEPQSDRTPRANCPTPDDTTPGQAGTPREATRSPPASPHPTGPPGNRARSCTSIPAWIPRAQTTHPRGAGSRGPPKAVLSPQAPTPSQDGDVGTHGVAASLLDTFLLFSQPGFPPEQRLGGGAWHRIGAKPAGLEQTGSRARHKHGFGDSGTHRPALSSVGLGQFPQALGLGVGLAPKMGFLLPKGIFQPPRLDETVSKGLGPGLIP
ncbi:hypothetical protein Q9966_000265 [Columba livia]|nr:hypothetical protein Q9966_000265 [Columba livia]